MLDLYLIRHAECELNLKPYLIGGRQNGSPLTKKGIHQARLLGERLASEEVSFDGVYSSIADRAIQTAMLACQHIDYPLKKIIQLEELQELDQGDWEGRIRKEVHTLKKLKEINSDNWEFTPPHGESQKNVEERIYGWVEENLIPQYKKNGLRAGLFTHGVAIKCFLRKVMGSNPKMTYKIRMDNTSITRLKYNRYGWHLLSVNDIGHLLKQ